ncbi:uncharacterized protein G2W53_014596 [Senna tora]|uniref:Uncharacterized protein n=1 Tax=Senna tora TaxID=362788 RepID=A0A834WTT5_9FABA|nr:uncharacterized protein G2W53_014596 [Senna tora]
MASGRLCFLLYMLVALRLIVASADDKTDSFESPVFFKLMVMDDSFTYYDGKERVIPRLMPYEVHTPLQHV